MMLSPSQLETDIMTNNYQQCADCREQRTCLTIRQRLLCEGCFSQYVSSKILKRMDTQRMKNQSLGTKRRLLLPISGGTSSLTLFHILNAQVEKQMRQQGRTAYELIVVHVTKEHTEPLTGWWKSLEEGYSMHTFVSLILLSDVFTLDKTLKTDITLLNLIQHPDEDDNQLLEKLFLSAKSMTAKSDLQDILLKRLIVSLAERENCKGIIWGHSDSKLAAHVLSAVAKGRGGAVSTELSEGISPWGVGMNYPMRDLFLHELDLFLDIVPDLQKHKLPQNEDKPITLRSTSIDQLMSTYITGQGEKYPSIMANVVRTASKLQPGQTTQLCKICGASSTADLCYGCQQMKQEMKM